MPTLFFLIIWIFNFDVYVFLFGYLLVIVSIAKCTHGWCDCVSDVLLVDYPVYTKNYAVLICLVYVLKTASLHYVICNEQKSLAVTHFYYYWYCYNRRSDSVIVVIPGGFWARLGGQMKTFSRLANARHNPLDKSVNFYPGHI